MSIRIDFTLINEAAVAHLPALLARWLPTGRRQGREYVALNPTRNDGGLNGSNYQFLSGQAVEPERLRVRPRCPDRGSGGGLIVRTRYTDTFRRASAMWLA
jgi:hypothetical protein